MSFELKEKEVIGVELLEQQHAHLVPYNNHKQGISWRKSHSSRFQTYGCEKNVSLENEAMVQTLTKMLAWKYECSGEEIRG